MNEFEADAEAPGHRTDGVCTRCRLPCWTHDLWPCVPYHMVEFCEEDDLRREVIRREINEGVLAGTAIEISDQAADLILAALNRYDAWRRDAPTRK